jgi:hypothetical protein
MKFHAMTLLILFAAFTCYGAGYGGGGLAFLFVAAVLEVGFWIRVGQAPRTHRTAHAIGLPGGPARRR